MRKIKIPAKDIIDLCSVESQKPVELKEGFFILILDRIVYMRDTDLGVGLIRVDTAVDITITKEWFDKIEEMI